MPKTYIISSSDNEKVLQKTQEVFGCDNYLILNYVKDYLCLDEKEEITQNRSVILSYPEKNLLSFSFPRKTPLHIIKKNSTFLFANEFVEGVFVHLFYDTRIQMWQLATLNSVGGFHPVNKLSFFKKHEHYVRNIFCDIFDYPLFFYSLPFLDALPKYCCYNFIIQHPKISSSFLQKKIYVIGAFSIDSIQNTATLVSPIILRRWNCFGKDVLFPKSIPLDLSLVNDQYLEELSMKNDLSGLVVHDIENGRHCVYKSKEYLLRCKNNHLPSLLFYKYLCLASIGQQYNYSSFYPQYKKQFKKFETLYHLQMEILFNQYFLCYVKKQSTNVNEKYIFYLKEIHQQFYLKSLIHGKKRPKVTKNDIYRYIETLSPEQQMYLFLYDERNKLL